MSVVARRTVLVIIAAIAMVSMTATASVAIGKVRYWNSYSNPLTIHSYGSYGWGYGTWDITTHSDGTRSRLHAQQALSNADDHKVFVKLTTDVNSGYCIQPNYTSCTEKYFYYDDSDTSHTTCYCWEARSTTTGLAAGGDYARARVNVKLDIPWRPDPSSGTTYTKGDSY